MVELSGGQDGFKILQVKFDAESQCPHHIFFKNHNVKAGCSKIDFFYTCSTIFPIFYGNAVNLAAASRVIVFFLTIYSFKLA
jgi:hypothetical protein